MYIIGLDNPVRTTMVTGEEEKEVVGVVVVVVVVVGSIDGPHEAFGCVIYCF